MKNEREKKKLIGIYLPISLIARLKKYISSLYMKDSATKNQSEIIEEAVKKYLDQNEKE